MTQRFGGIFSILSKRDYNDLINALRSVDEMDMRVGDFSTKLRGYEGLSWGEADSYEIDTEQIIELLDVMSISQIIEVLEHYSDEGGKDSYPHEDPKFQEYYKLAMTEDEDTKKIYTDLRTGWTKANQVFKRLLKKLESRKRS